MSGWSPAQVTYDANGDVLSVTVTEPRFTRGDVEALLASRRAERAPRGSHGILLAEATDPALKSEWVVRKPKRDYVAQKLHAEQTFHQKAYPHEDHSAFLWTVTRPEE